MDRGGWQATVHGVTKSRTRLSDSHALSLTPLVQVEVGSSLLWSEALSA